MAARRPRPMKAPELRNSLTTLDLSFVDFAQMMGVHANTVSRWVNGRTPVPGAVAFLVRGMKAERKRA